VKCGPGVSKKRQGTQPLAGPASAMERVQKGRGGKGEACSKWGGKRRTPSGWKQASYPWKKLGSDKGRRLKEKKERGVAAAVTKARRKRGDQGDR